MRSVRWASLLATLAACALAQDKPPRIDVQHYTIDADINPRTQSLVATAKIDFTPLDDAPSAVFELNNALKVSKVTDGSGQVLTATRSGKDLDVNVSFPTPLEKNKPAQISFSYEGQFTGTQDSPVYGITFAELK